MLFRHPPKRVLTAKLWFYSLGGFTAAVLLFVVLLFLGRNLDPSGLPLFIVVAPPFAFLALGALWMMKTAVLEEPKPWLLIFLACCLPFSFLWYYYERVKPARLASQE